MLTLSTERLCIDNPPRGSAPIPAWRVRPLQSPLLGRTRPNTLALPVAGRAILLGVRMEVG